MLVCPFCGEAPRPDRMVTAITVCRDDCARTTAGSFGRTALRWNLTVEGNLGERVGWLAGTSLVVVMDPGRARLVSGEYFADASSRPVTFPVGYEVLDMPMDEMVAEVVRLGDVARVMGS